LEKYNIIPKRQVRIGIDDQINFEAICCFIACGFFLEGDTYYKGLKSPTPGSFYNEFGKENKYFDWYSEPRINDLENAVDIFSDILDAQLINLSRKNVILPLSGGLDSRTLMAGLIKNSIAARTYSYEFEDGHHETLYGQQISEIAQFDFEGYTIKRGSMWKNIDFISDTNGCYAEFTNARQICVSEKLNEMSGDFLLGHGGDLFFDNMKFNFNISDDEAFLILKNNIIKQGGLELAIELWKIFGLNGDFKIYLSDRLMRMWKSIDIIDTNSKYRAFKTKFYVSRWTCTNLDIFDRFGNKNVPFFDDRMCDFICNVSENLLNNRKIQIEYIKRYAPSLAKVEWQEHSPFNLYNYKFDKFPLNLPNRLINKLKIMRSQKKYIQRNWELQFLGDENDKILKQYLFNSQSCFIDHNVISKFYNLFKLEPLKYAHPISMLLTLKIWEKKFKK
jgi:hypothetical protein